MPDMPVVNGIIDLALKIQKTSEDAITAIKNFFNREDKQTQEAVIFDYFSKNSVKYTKEEDSTGYDYLNGDVTYKLTDEPLFNTAFKEREFNGFVESNIFSNSISGSHFFCMPILNVPDSLKRENNLIQLLSDILYITSTKNFIDIKSFLCGRGLSAFWRIRPARSAIAGAIRRTFFYDWPQR